MLDDLIESYTFISFSKFHRSVDLLLRVLNDSEKGDVMNYPLIQEDLKENSLGNPKVVECKLIL